MLNYIQSDVEFSYFCQTFDYKHFLMLEKCCVRKQNEAIPLASAELIKVKNAMLALACVLQVYNHKHYHYATNVC